MYYLLHYYVNELTCRKKNNLRRTYTTYTRTYTTYTRIYTSYTLTCTRTYTTYTLTYTTYTRTYTLTYTTYTRTYTPTLLFSRYTLFPLRPFVNTLLSLPSPYDKHFFFTHTSL